MDWIKYIIGLRGNPVLEIGYVKTSLRVTVCWALCVFSTSVGKKIKRPIKL